MVNARFRARGDTRQTLNIATEVAESKWGGFCDRLQRLGEGSMATIEVAEADGRRSIIVDGAPLTRIFLDEESDRCNNTLVMETGKASGSPARHVVVEPIHIRLKRGKDRKRYNEVHIIAENGITVLKLHPGIAPGAFRGLGARTRTGSRPEAGQMQKRPGKLRPA